jgi:hypothetical protein
MHKEPENISQLLVDFSEYYFGMKPMMKTDTLKRLFFGQLKKEGLFAHLQRCHEDTGNIKTKTLVQLFHKLVDHSKCHQVQDIIDIWRG